MAEVVNLRMARKRRDRASKDKAAGDARAKHCTSKAEKAAIKAKSQRTSRQLDGARLERDD